MKNFFGFKLDKHSEWIDDLEPNIPDFIYDEMSEKEKHKELKTKKKVSTFTAIDAVNIKQYQNIG